jgi:hypothetical protein
MEADEVAASSAARIVVVVVSLLEAEEAPDLRLQDEARLRAARRINFMSFSIPDRGCPDASDAPNRHIADWRLAAGRAGRRHSLPGLICRSSLIATGTLAWLGVDPAAALDVPDTDAQRAWVLSFEPRRTKSCAQRKRAPEDPAPAIAPL